MTTSKIHFCRLMNLFVTSDYAYCVRASRSPVRAGPIKIKSGEWYYYQFSPAGEMIISWGKTPSERSDPYVFSIVGKLFENEREWCYFHADILKIFWVIRVSKMKIHIFLSDFVCILLFSSYCSRHHKWPVLLTTDQFIVLGKMTVILTCCMIGFGPKSIFLKIIKCSSKTTSAFLTLHLRGR